METHDKEILDLVQRKGPVTFDDLMDHISVYSQDDVYISLVYLEEQGYVEEIDGSLDEHGTTQSLWNDTDKEL